VVVVVSVALCVFFFFSSRRRHTRFSRDWSSDVCSSDLAVTAIEAEESARPPRRAVAGYDYTFSVPKSVSALWAVADGGTQALIRSEERRVGKERRDRWARED